MSDLLFSESLRTWSSTTQRSQLKNGNKKTCKSRVCHKNEIIFETWCVLTNIRNFYLSNYRKNSSKILTEIHSFYIYLPLSDIMANQVAIVHKQSPLLTIFFLVVGLSNLLASTAFFHKSNGIFCKAKEKGSK